MAGAVANNEVQQARGPIDLASYVCANAPAGAETGSEKSLALLFCAISLAVKQIASKNDVMTDALLSCPEVLVIASEEDDDPVTSSLGAAAGARFVVVFDPLDGSRNIDAAIPTGWLVESTLSQQGTQGFTLDPLVGDFMLTHPDIKIPKRGQIYSVNDARYYDWPAGLQRYIDTIRQGKGQNPKQYSARYICSLVGDFHRTLLYGGVCMNPRCHLRLVYEANPLAMLVEQSGGIGSDGKKNIREIAPSKLHQRLPLFLGSPEDMLELMSYEDVQQLDGKTYEV
eukprot:gene12263-12401_t